ncbi:MAG: hypothetical protein ACLQLO_09645 [Mycobacterium sp.]
MPTTTPTLAERAAAAQAEANQLRAEADRIDAAGRAAADEARLTHYRRAATEVAGEYRGRRDDLMNKVNQVAMADQIDLNLLFKSWVEMRDCDAQAGALNVHSSMLDSLDPPQKQWNGAHPMPAARAAVNELYTPRNGWTFTSFVDRVLAQRADRIRAQHRAELEAQAHDEIQAAEQSARTAAAASD